MESIFCWFPTVIKCRVTLLCIAYNHHFEKAVKANQIKVFEALKEEGRLESNFPSRAAG